MPLNANATKVRNALFETIAASADQVQATNAADVLARDNALPTQLSVAAGLHPQWVRAQIGANAATAIFAVTNCHDPDVLDAFAHTETRVTVLRAIAYNEFTTPETVRFCEDRLDARIAPAPQGFHEAVDLELAQDPAPYVAPEIPEALQVPAPFARPGFTEIDPACPLSGLPPAVLTLSRPKAAIDTLIERAMAANAEDAIAGIVCGYYGPKLASGPAIKFWNATGLNPTELLATLPKTHQRNILECLIEEREDSSWNAPVNIWDPGLIDLMIESKVACPSNWSPSPGEPFLTPTALDKVLATPRLWPLLYLAPLTVDNVVKVFETVKRDVRDNLIDTLTDEADPEVISTALLYDGPTNIRSELFASGFDALAHILAGPSDPGVLVAASLANSGELISYLLEGTEFIDSRGMPLPEQVPQLVTLALAKAPNVEDFAYDLRFLDGGDFEAMSPEYVRALMDHVPCAWELLLTNETTSALVIRRIEEVVGLDVAMARLFATNALAPATLPQVLASLA